MPLVIFTDLDGTLLDATYSFGAALPALEAVRKRSIPCVICSSKTRSEIEHYRKKLSNTHPFISENGGGTFIPNGYFKFRISNLEFDKIPDQPIIHQETDYEVVRLGRAYAELREAVMALRAEGFNVRGFGDMTPEEVARTTGLDLLEAGMAKERESDEPFLFEGDKVERSGLLQAIQAKGLRCTEGQLFYHLTGNNDKGKAVTTVSALYRRTVETEIVTMALGDGPNDIPMLEAVDVPIIVQKPGSVYDKRFEGKHFIKADGVGPKGWNKAVLKLLDERQF